jgi:hypothetical protein
MQPARKSKRTFMNFCESRSATLVTGMRTACGVPTLPQVTNERLGTKRFLNKTHQDYWRCDGDLL